MMELIPVGSSVSDLGAGVGRGVAYFLENRRPCLGYDGIPEIETLSQGLVFARDLSQYHRWQVTDWCVSIEVGEHVPSEREDAFLSNLSNASRYGLILSWGTPGQPGTGHVNCRWPDYLRVKLTRHFNWNFSNEETTQLRRRAPSDYYNKLMVFRR